MKIKQTLLFFSLFVFSFSGIVYAQIPPGYYDAANGLTGTALQAALHNIIKNHNSITYGEVITAFSTTDVKTGNIVWDTYSDVPGGTPPYVYHYNSSDECGNYSGEGDCYNREHSWPQSWFGDGAYPMYSDLFHLYPTDGYVNGKRSNYPYGKVGQVSWTSQNGSKLGSSASSGYTGTVFEPINEYKGDFARSYFYMSVRYYTEDSGWPGSAATTGSQLKAWELAQLKQWSSQDPVSTKEINRNNAIYQIQDNRNPFIDHPEYVSAIWGPVTGTDDISAGNITIYPNPVKDVCYISDPERSFSRGSTILITTETGTPVKAEFRFEEGRVAIDAAQLHPGLYVVTVTFPGTAIYHGKFIRE